MSSSSIRLAIHTHIARITLARPERHNALGAQDIALFRSLLDAVEADAQVRVLVLTGSGESTFCSGASLAEMQSGDMSGELFSTLTDRLAGLEIPSVCVLNGSVYGGGAEIALCCDYRVGVEGMRLQVPAARIGLCYPLAGLTRFVDKLGLGAAKRILVGAEEMDAATLCAIGFLHRVVPRADLEPEAQALSDHLSGLAPLAVRTMKRLLGEIARGELKPEQAEERIRACGDSADLQEGLAAQRERRAPRFEGR